MPLIDEYNEVIETCEKFARNEIAPQALEADLEADIGWARSIWTKSREIGLPGLLIPEEFNGVGQSEGCSALTLNVLASECAGIASIFAHHFAAAIPVTGGNQAQKEKYLLPLANVDVDEPSIAAVIFPSDTSEDPVSIEEREGKLFLSGTSPLVGNAELANLLCVFVEEGEKGDGVTCLLIENHIPGVSPGQGALLPGLKINPFAPVVFKNLEIDSASILGDRGMSRPIMETAQNVLYGFIAAMAMGTARSAYQKARIYAEERFQFGKIIINHQEIQRLLGNMLAKLNAGTVLCTQLFAEESLNLPYSSPDAALAKTFCTDGALEIALDAIQVHGGYGYMHEYGVEKIMRDSKVLQLLGGSSPLLHRLAIARDL